MGAEPQQPVGTVSVVQQGEVEAVLRLRERRVVGQQSRAGNGDQHGRHQAGHLQAGIHPKPVAQGNIDTPAVHVHQRGSGLDTHLDIRMQAVESP